MSTVLALDPGPRQSGWAVLGGPRGAPFAVLDHGTESNEDVLLRVLSGRTAHGDSPPDRLVVERPVGYGARAGLDLMNTAIWAGRFVQAWDSEHQGFRGWALVSFAEVAQAVCGRRGGLKERDVWIGVLDLYGGQERAVGGVRCRVCKGKGWVGRGRPPCEPCGASGYEVWPGPMHGVHSHARSAVAVAVADRLILRGSLG